MLLSGAAVILAVRSPAHADPPGADLPETNLTLDRTWSTVRARLEDSAHAPDFGSVALPRNPLAVDATPIGSATCMGCHSVEQAQFAHTMHDRAFRAGAAGATGDSNCETCHGPGSAHAANPASPGAIIRFTHGAPTPVATQTGTCLACHAAGARQHWLGSIHEARGLSCSDCHNPMTRLSPEGLLATSSINAVCAGCHQDVRAKFNRRSHMPLPEGR